MHHVRISQPPVVRSVVACVILCCAAQAQRAEGQALLCRVRPDRFSLTGGGRVGYMSPTTCPEGRMASPSADGAECPPIRRAHR